MSGQEEHQHFMMLQIKALQLENEKLNNKIKELNFKIRLSDPNFYKPILQIKKDEQITRRFL